MSRLCRRLSLICLLLCALLAVPGFISNAFGADTAKTTGLEKATFAGGCFWGVQDEFDHVKGVVSTKAGYTDGSAKNPSYEQVCGGSTGHCEAVEVTFDPKVVSYGQLLKTFWQLHDPTNAFTKWVHGGQYRSAIFYYSPEQEKTAQASKIEFEKHVGKSVVTEIKPAATFFSAEEYHQHYHKKNGGGCHR